MKFKLFSLLLLFIFASCSSAPKVSQESKKKSILYFDHGTQKLVDRDYTQALNYLLKAEAEDPTDSQIQNNLGMAFYFKGQSSMAKDHLKKAIELNSKNTEARNNLAAVYMETSEYSKAEDEYQKVLSDLVFRGQYATYYNLALLSLKKNKKPEAIGYLKKSLEENPDYCPSYFVLGNVMKEEYRYKDAMAYFSKGSQGACSNNPAPLYELANIYQSLDNSENASQKYQEVIERFPDTEYAEKARVVLKKKERENLIQIRTKLENQSYKTPTF